MLALHSKPAYLKLFPTCQGLKTQIERPCDNTYLLCQDLKVEAVGQSEFKVCLSYIMRQSQEKTQIKAPQKSPNLQII